jgi:2-methylcitrate dehydratase PrpD
MGLIEEFAAALRERGDEGLAENAAHETRRCLMNVLGTSIGASQYAEADALVGVGRSEGAGTVMPPGRRETLDRFNCALEIGFTAHFDDFDDTHLETVIHPGAAVLGALWPIALERKTPGPVSLAAFALGMESQLRVGIAMSPSHYDAGWHITGTCGVIGAAVAAGYLSGFTTAKLASAIGLAANFPIGHREAFGTPVKPFHAGKAAMNGLLAAELAATGVGYDPDVLEREGGYFPLLAETYDLTGLGAASVASSYALLDTTYKPFPCGIVAHPAIEAAIGLHAKVDAPGAPQIVAVTVRCNPLVLELMGRPTASTGLEARFCALHGVAVGLLYGAGGLAEFSDEVAVAPAVDDLRRRSRLSPDPDCGRESATVVVEFADGSVAENVVLVAGGSRERPLTDEQLLAKFTALVEPVLPGRAASIAAAAMGLGATTSFADIAFAVHGR